jgi:hypothetical protein
VGDSLFCFPLQTEKHSSFFFQKDFNDSDVSLCLSACCPLSFIPSLTVTEVLLIQFTSPHLRKPSSFSRNNYRSDTLRTLVCLCFSTSSALPNDPVSYSYQTLNLRLLQHPNSIIFEISMAHILFSDRHLICSAHFF